MADNNAPNQNGQQSHSSELTPQSPDTSQAAPDNAAQQQVAPAVQQPVDPAAQQPAQVPPAQQSGNPTPTAQQPGQPMAAPQPMQTPPAQQGYQPQPQQFVQQPNPTYQPSSGQVPAAGAPQSGQYPQYNTQQPNNPYQPPYQQQPYQQQAYQQQYQQQQYQQQPYVEVPDRSTMYIVLSILEILFCGGLIAIIPLVFSVQYKTAFSNGDMVSAKAREKSARIWLIVALCVGIVALIFTISMVSSGLYD